MEGGVALRQFFLVAAISRGAMELIQQAALSRGAHHMDANTQFVRETALGLSPHLPLVLVSVETACICRLCVTH